MLDLLEVLEAFDRLGGGGVPQAAPLAPPSPAGGVETGEGRPPGDREWVFNPVGPPPNLPASRSPTREQPGATRARAGVAGRGEAWPQRGKAKSDKFEFYFANITSLGLRGWDFIKEVEESRVAKTRDLGMMGFVEHHLSGARLTQASKKLRKYGWGGALSLIHI
eukprot:3656615-Pyramimonas_sp.AAC.1